MYQTNHSQCVYINNTQNKLETTISSVTQEAIPYLHWLPQFQNQLKPESKVIKDYFKKNKMVVNSDKFQAFILDKPKSDHTNESVTDDNQHVKGVSFLKRLSLKLDNKLNFNLYIRQTFAHKQHL